MRYDLALIECLVMASERPGEGLREALQYARGLNPQSFNGMTFEEFKQEIDRVAAKTVRECLPIVRGDL